jgi:hypothetical protein
MPDGTELRCELDVSDPHTMHRAVLADYAYPGSRTRVDWDEGDRRTFHGEWPGVCDAPGCPLPNGHHGRHA